MNRTDPIRRAVRRLRGAAAGGPFDPGTLESDPELVSALGTHPEGQALLARIRDTADPRRLAVIAEQLELIAEDLDSARR